MEIPAGVAWVLSKNPRLHGALKAEYPLEHGYWNYLNEVVSSLREKGCKGIQEKIADVDNLDKFKSATSELEIARFLGEKGKQIELLPDNFLPTKSPDMYVKDEIGEYYIEVVRFSDDETTEIIQDELNEYLANLPKRYQVNVSLPADLSNPAIDCNEREIKNEKVRSIILKLKRTLDSMNLNRLPSTVSEDGIVLHFSESTIGVAFVGLIDYSVITVCSEQFVDRIKYLITDKTRGKAIKRTKWTDDDLKRYYIVAIDCDQPNLQEEEVITALLGHSTTFASSPPKKTIPPKILEAAKKNWTAFLEKVYLLPRDRTIFDSYDGVYFTDPICENVSGVLVYKGLLPRSESMVCFVPNPFAEDIINDSRLTRFI